MCFRNLVAKNQRKGHPGRTARMNSHRGHRVHVWLCDVFDRNRDVEIPSANCLVIRRGDKPPIIIHESDCVDRPKVLVVFLCNFSRPDVVLSGVSCLYLE